MLPGDAAAAIDEFGLARAETIRYHETLYRSTSLGTRGSWLAHPHPLVMDSLGGPSSACLRRLLGGRKHLAAALAAYTLAMGVGFFGVTGPASFGGFFFAHVVLSGCYFTGAASLSQMLFPKLKFAQFASAAGLVMAVVNVAAGPVLGLLLDWLGHDYRFTFGVGCLVGLLAVLVNLMVYRRFLALGGPRGYVAPE